MGEMPNICTAAEGKYENIFFLAKMEISAQSRSDLHGGQGIKKLIKKSQNGDRRSERQRSPWLARKEN